MAKKKNDSSEISENTKHNNEIKLEVTSTTIENDNLSFEKQNLSHCRVKYSVTPKAPLWEKAKKEAVKKVSKDISIPGFRKGKAPAHIILNKYSAQIQQQTESCLADLCFAECQKEAKVPILQGNNNISFHTEGKDTDKKLFFEFETEPTIPEIDLANFSLPKHEAETINEKRVNDELDNVRSFYAEWKQVEDRAVEEGDFVLLDIYDLDQNPPSRVFNSARFEVKEGKMVTWMRDLVIGLSIGESIEGISKPDSSASEEDKQAFTEKKIKITLVAIETSFLPEINDDLAKKLGAPNVTVLKERLEKLVASKAARATDELLRDSIEHQMIEKVLFEIPGSLLEREANHRMNQLFEDAEFKKEWEEQMSEEQKTAKKEEIKEKSTQAIRLFYLCRNIVGKNHISVGHEDMNSSFDSVLDMLYADQKKLQYKSMTEDQKQMVLTRVMMQKAEDHIIRQLQKA